MFEKDESTGHWNETAKLTASDGHSTDYFGYAVSAFRNRAIVGAYMDDDDNGDRSGSAYVFQKNQSTGIWAETAKLKASDGAAGDQFGRSVSISGKIVIVGAYRDDDYGYNSGSLYVYEMNESTGVWSEAAKLTASDGAAGDFFGCSVSVSGNIVIAGAYGDDDNGLNSGSAYVFEKNESTGIWIETAKL